MDKIAIVIVHYNTDQDTRETLESLAGIRTDGFEVKTIVVDNASREPLSLGSLENNSVKVIRSETNLGFTGGNNLGFQTASNDFNPDYFLLLNSDTLVDPDFLVNLYTNLQQHPDWGMATPKMYFAPGCEYHCDAYDESERGRVIWYAGGSIDWNNMLTIHRGVDEVDRGQFEKAETVDFATGCCVLVRREILASVGVFDDKFFLYYEDADLSQRVRAHSFQIGMVPEAIIWHKNGGSTEGSGSELQTFYQTRNRLYFFWKHGDWLVRQRVIRLAVRLLKNGSRVEKLAARNFLSQKMGKQVTI